jgi:hypothetical protein
LTLTLFLIIFFQAMLTLYGLKDEMHNKTGAPLDLWLKKHGLRTIEKFKFLKEENQFMGPVPFKQNKHLTEVFIDPEQKFNMGDKLSQVIVKKFLTRPTILTPSVCISV